MSQHASRFANMHVWQVCQHACLAQGMSAAAHLITWFRESVMSTKLRLFKETLAAI